VEGLKQFRKEILKGRSMREERKRLIHGAFFSVQKAYMRNMLCNVFV